MDKIIYITDDFALTIKISELKNEQVEEVILHLLKEAKAGRDKKAFEKLLKSLRHRINKYLNFGKF